MTREADMLLSRVSDFQEYRARLTDEGLHIMFWRFEPAVSAWQIDEEVGPIPHWGMGVLMAVLMGGHGVGRWAEAAVARGEQISEETARAVGALELAGAEIHSLLAWLEERRAGAALDLRVAWETLRTTAGYSIAARSVGTALKVGTGVGTEPGEKAK